MSAWVLERTISFSLQCIQVWFLFFPPRWRSGEDLLGKKRAPSIGLSPHLWEGRWYETFFQHHNLSSDLMSPNTVEITIAWGRNWCYCWIRYGFSKGRSKGTVVSLVLLQRLCHDPEESDFYDRREWTTRINTKVKIFLSGYNKLSTTAFIWGLERWSQICDTLLLSLHWAGVEVPVYCLVAVAVAWFWLGSYCGTFTSEFKPWGLKPIAITCMKYKCPPPPGRMTPARQFNISFPLIHRYGNST